MQLRTVAIMYRYLKITSTGHFTSDSSVPNNKNNEQSGRGLGQQNEISSNRKNEKKNITLTLTSN